MIHQYLPTMRTLVVKASTYLSFKRTPLCDTICRAAVCAALMNCSGQSQSYSYLLMMHKYWRISSSPRPKECHDLVPQVWCMQREGVFAENFAIRQRSPEEVELVRKVRNLTILIATITRLIWLFTEQARTCNYCALHLMYIYKSHHARR